MTEPKKATITEFFKFTKVEGTLNLQGAARQIAGGMAEHSEHSEQADWDAAAAMETADAPLIDKGSNTADGGPVLASEPITEELNKTEVQPGGSLQAPAAPTPDEHFVFGAYYEDTVLAALLRRVLTLAVRTPRVTPIPIAMRHAWSETRVRSRFPSFAPPPPCCLHAMTPTARRVRPRRGARHHGNLGTYDVVDVRATDGAAGWQQRWADQNIRGCLHLRVR